MTRVHSLPVEAIDIGNRHRQDPGDIDALAASIETVGLLQPIAVRPDKRLVAGARRLAAVKQLGWDTVPVRVVEDLDERLRLLQAERDENTCRKDFTMSEAVALSEDIEADRLKEEAEKRKRAGKSADGKAGGRGRRKPSAESAEGNGAAERPRDTIAAAAGVGRDKLRKAAVVVKAAEEDPERFGPIRDEMDKTGNVDRAFKRVQKMKTPPPPPPPPPRYPYSDTLRAWLDLVN